MRHYIHDNEMKKKMKYGLKCKASRFVNDDCMRFYADLFIFEKESNSMIGFL